MTVSQLCNISRCNVEFYTLNSGKFELAAKYFVRIDRLLIEEGHNDCTFDTVVVSLEADAYGELVAYIRS